MNLSALTIRAMSGNQVIYAAPITYEVDGKQFVSVIAGNILIAYALRQP